MGDTDSAGPQQRGSASEALGYGNPIEPAGSGFLGHASFTRLEGRELGDPRNGNPGGADATWIN